MPTISFNHLQTFDLFRAHSYTHRHTHNALIHRFRRGFAALQATLLQQTGEIPTLRLELLVINGVSVKPQRRRHVGVSKHRLNCLRVGVA